MRQIDGYPLWIGTARDVKGLHDIGIEAVVDLAADEPPAVLSRDLVYLRFPLVDGGENPPWLIAAAVAGTGELVSLGVPTLVACGNGMSRSVSVAAAALWRRTPDTRVHELLARVKGGGPSDVHPALWSSIFGCCFTVSSPFYRPRD